MNPKCPIRPNRAGAALGALLFLSGCSGKEPIVQPEAEPILPVLPEGVTVSGNVVSWSTDVDSRGSVRYGLRADDLDHMAYPAARDRGDRALKTTHDVRLLDVQAGQTIYMQTANEVPGVAPVYSDLGNFHVTAAATAPLLTSTMIHIGFGDCHLITMPNGNRLMIDGGERPAQGAVQQYMSGHGVSNVHSMLATHVHIDHIGSFVGDSFRAGDGILQLLRPLTFLDSPQKSFNRFAYGEALQAATDAGARRVVLLRGQTSTDNADLAFDPAVRVVVLSSGTPPDYTPTGGDEENTDINNDSIVLRFSYGDVDFVIGGDAEEDAEASILRAFPAAELEVEYYKSHHHGLGDANSASWIHALQPRVAFIPNTDLVWDGPLASAIAATTSALQRVGSHIYAIDDAPSLGRPRFDDGNGPQYNVTFATDGISYEVRLEFALQTPPLRKVTLGTACVPAVPSSHAMLRNALAMEDPR